MAQHHQRHDHGHTHGAIDPSIATTERGIWAVKWSFVGLCITALLQVVAVWLTGSVSIHAEAVAVGDLASDLPAEHHRGITQAHR
jgi:hypothetical protein